MKNILLILDFVLLLSLKGIEYLSILDVDSYIFFYVMVIVKEIF